MGIPLCLLVRGMKSRQKRHETNKGERFYLAQK